MATNLTAQALEGWNAPFSAKSPYYASSPAHMAWRVGQWKRATGRSEPRHVAMSRGYTLRVDDMLVRWLPHDDDVQRIA